MNWAAVNKLEEYYHFKRPGFLPLSLRAKKKYSLLQQTIKSKSIVMHHLILADLLDYPTLSAYQYAV